MSSGSPLSRWYLTACLHAALCCRLLGQTAENVLVVVNDADSLSRRIGSYYVHKRLVPLKNVCRLRTSTREEIPWNTYETEIEWPIAAHLRKNKQTESVLYIVTTRGVPLKIAGDGSGAATEAAAVDSELALLYDKMRGRRHPRSGAVNNPFFMQRRTAFTHPRFPIYLVTRLAGYDFEDVRGMIDRALSARNRGKVVIDLKSDDDATGNDWLRSAAIALPAGRVVLDVSTSVLYRQREVIGYASWGSNDPNRKQRFLQFQWLPGAIVTEYVSTNARTFERPPADWNITTWSDREHYFGGSPQTLAADYIHEGATGCSGHVNEPYLQATPRPQYLFPAYLGGRTLAESFYLAMPSLSWQNIVIGDPLCRLK